MGNFIFRFLKELNSSTSTKMMVLAVVLGLLAGFLPGFNLFTFLIFIIVFIFRIPIGLFLASFSVFGVVGYFLDPLFNKIGYSVLTFSFFKPLWTFFYNVPFFRWSGFNNTIVIGSLISGIVLGVIFYFVLNKIAFLYRKIVFEKLEKIKFLSWLVPNEKKGIIRFSGLFFLLGVGAVISLFFMFLLDPIIKYSLEFVLSKTLHKKVAIESVDTSIKNLSIDIKNMQIDNVLFKKVYTKLDWDKLIWRKYKIDDLKFMAQTNKNIYDIIKSNQKNKKRATNLISSLHIKLPNPKEFLAKENLKSIAAIKKLQKDYQKVRKDLNNLKTDKYKKDFDNLKKKLDSFKNIKINSPADLQNLIADINSIKKEANLLIKSIKNERNLLIKDKNLIINDLKNVKLALKEDEKNIKSKYEMLKNKEYMKFAESFLKPQIAKYVSMASKIYGKIKPYLRKQSKKPEYIRHKGIYIKFKDKIKYPDFVLVAADGEVKTPIAKWNLTLRNLSDNQLLLSKEAFGMIKGKSRYFDVGADISYLKNIKFKAYGNRIKLKNININFAMFNALLNMKASGVIYNKNINAKILAYFENVKLQNLQKEIKKILGNSLFKIRNFNVVVSLKGNITSPTIKIYSNLDKIFAKIINRKINELINKQIIKTQNLLNAQIQNSLKKIDLNVIDTKLNVLNELGNNKNLIDEKAMDIIKSKGGFSVDKVIKGLLPF